MTSATTDSALVLNAREFLWRSSELTEAHDYILPRVVEFLSGTRAQTVLDIGCGNGAFTSALASRGFDVLGLDSSASGMAIARRSYPNICFRHGDVNESLPIDLFRGFDAVVAVEVVEHLLLPRKLFERAAEALRPGGSFIVTTPYHGYLKNLALALTGKFDQHWHPMRDFGHVKFFSVKTLSTIFEEQGFSIRCIERVGRIPPLAKSMVIEGVRLA